VLRTTVSGSSGVGGCLLSVAVCCDHLFLVLPLPRRVTDAVLVHNATRGRCRWELGMWSRLVASFLALLPSIPAPFHSLPINLPPLPFCPTYPTPCPFLATAWLDWSPRAGMVCLAFPAGTPSRLLDACLTHLLRAALDMQAPYSSSRLWTSGGAGFFGYDRMCYLQLPTAPPLPASSGSPVLAIIPPTVGFIPFTFVGRLLFTFGFADADVADF